MKDGGEKGREFLRLARLSSVGFALIICTLVGYGIGYYIDKTVHTRPVFTIIFLLFGVTAGFLNVFRTIAKNSD